MCILGRTSIIKPREQKTRIPGSSSVIMQTCTTMIPRIYLRNGLMGAALEGTENSNSSGKTGGERRTNKRDGGCRDVGSSLGRLVRTKGLRKHTSETYYLLAQLEKLKGTLRADVPPG